MSKHSYPLDAESFDNVVAEPPPRKKSMQHGAATVRISNMDQTDAIRRHGAVQLVLSPIKISIYAVKSALPLNHTTTRMMTKQIITVYAIIMTMK